MADTKRVTVRLDARQATDLEVVVAATGLPVADVIRAAVKRLSDGHRFLADTGRSADDCVTDGGVMLLVPLLRREKRR